jgi:hypothetical protein
MRRRLYRDWKRWHIGDVDDGGTSSRGMSVILIERRQENSVMSNHVTCKWLECAMRIDLNFYRDCT